MFYQMMAHPIQYSWVLVYNSIYAKPINSEQKAKELGEYIAHKFFPDIDYSKYEPVKISDYGTHYSIAYFLPPKIEKLPDFVPLEEGDSGERLVYSKGGGGPEIIIEKSTGKIFSWGLQK